jgi:hypothetical protein
MTDTELDQRLLAQASTSWQKIAMIVAKAMRGDLQADMERAGRRVEELVRAGKLESVGNVRDWRASEVRLPR